MPRETEGDDDEPPAREEKPGVKERRTMVAMTTAERSSQDLSKHRSTVEGRRKLGAGGGDGDQPHNDRVPRAKAPLTNRPTEPKGSGARTRHCIILPFRGSGASSEIIAESI